MILSTQIVVTDALQNILEVNVDVEWWVKAGQKSSSISESFDDDIIIESITDDTGYDWSDDLCKDVITMLRKQCKKELEES